MARVEVAMQPWGQLTDRNGRPLSGLTPSFSGTVYSGASGSTEVSSFVSDSEGFLPGYVETGSYSLTEPSDGTVRSVEAVSAQDLDRVAGLETVASASNITIPDGVSLVEITGTTTIDTISDAEDGRIVTLLFRAACTCGGFSATADDTLTLAFDGTAWYVVTSSVN